MKLKALVFITTILSLFLAGRRFDIWATNERAFQLPDATFLCE